LQRSTLAKRLWLLLSAAACLTYLYGLGDYPLVGADEPRYAQVAREMYARGDLLTPTLGGLHWFEKPPLPYWMMMAGYGVLGVSESAARLGPALSGLLCVLSLGLLARQVEEKLGEAGRWLGLCVAGVLASSAGLLTFSRGASFDVVLTACTTSALSFFLAAELDEDAPRRRLLLAGFYSAVGLATLAKGLAGVLIPAGVVGGYFLSSRRWPPLNRLGVWWGAALALAVGAVWYAPAVARHGWEFVDEFFVQHHFARYVSDKYRHPQPFFYYLYIMPLLALPWTLFAAEGLWGPRGRGAGGDPTERKFRAFAAAWLLFPVVFFSFSGSKLPGYVLPALPGAALLAGAGLSRYVRGGAGVSLMRATGVGALCMCAAGVIHARRGGSIPMTATLAITAPAFVAGVSAVFLARRRALCAGSLVACAFVTAAMIVSLAAGRYAAAESVRDLLREADAGGLGGLPILQLHDVERTSEFYGAGRLAYAADGQPLKLEGPYEVVREAGARGGRALVIVPSVYLHQLENVRGASTRLVAENGVHALVYVEAGGV
jgi:4-amino-4-deoxy-L-arabinose transferase-like glycosyltransferase